MNALPSNGALEFPNGTYKITAALSIPFMTGKRIYGESRSVTIIQYTNNTPIFQTTTQDTHSMEIDHLTLKYNTQQTSSNTASYGIALTEPSNSGDGFYYWNVHDIWVLGAYVGIGLTGSSGTRVPIWSSSFKDIVMSNIAYSGLSLVSPTTIGMPNILVENLSISNGSVVPTGPAINLIAVEFDARGLDIESWHNTVFMFSGGTEANLSRVHIEHEVFDQAYPKLFQIANGPLTISNISVSCDNGPAAVCNLTTLFSVYAGGTLNLQTCLAYIPQPSSGSIQLSSNDGTATVNVSGFSASPNDISH